MYLDDFFLDTGLKIESRKLPLEQLKNYSRVAIRFLLYDRLLTNLCSSQLMWRSGADGETSGEFAIKVPASVKAIYQIKFDV